MPDEKTIRLHIVDDNELVRNSLGAILQDAGYDVLAFASGTEFLKALPGLNPDCVILDVRMPQMSGLDVLVILKRIRPKTPVVIMSGFADVSMAVKAMQSGASDFVEKPFRAEDVLDSMEMVLEAPSPTVTNAEAAALLSSLSTREMEILSRLVQGKQNKVVARELEISPRTVEVHRARIMQRLEVTSFAGLVKLSVISGLAID